jgi:hypothetical protein
LLALAQEEGVTALVASRLPDTPVRTLMVDATRGLAAASMLRIAECERVFSLLAQVGREALLLKGSALACWLYPAPHLRECADIDLLLDSRDDVAEAARLFAGHGYALGYEQGETAYELVCRREGGGRMRMDLDLHWALNNAPVFARAFGFDELLAASIALPAIAVNARGLGPVHALLHACMHRAINLYTGVDDRLKWLYDIHLLADRLQSQEWDEVLRLCRERRLSGVCVAGLDAAADWFGPAAPAAVVTALRAMPLDGGVDGQRLHDWRYMHRMNLRALPGWRARGAWLARKLFPTRAHLREMHGVDRNLAGLVLARVRALLRKAG